MIRSLPNGALCLVLITLFKTTIASAETTPLAATQLTTTTSGLTTTQQVQAAQTSQNLIDSKNTVLALASTTTATTDPLYSRAADINLLYGTSFNEKGPSASAWDQQVLNLIKSTPGYTPTAYLTWLTKTAQLYRALQSNQTLRASFNKTYKTWLPATGSPALQDTNILFGITKPSTYNQTQFFTALAAGTAAPIPQSPPPPQTLPQTPPSTLPGKIFAATSFWNAKRPANQTLQSNSSALVQELVANTQMAPPWFNTANYSTPYYVVDSGTPKSPVSIVQNGVTLTWSVLHTRLQAGVPIPANVLAAGGTDGTLTIYDKSTDRLYEFWQFKKVNNKWQATWGGIIDRASTSNGIMPTVINSAGGKEYFGATATGLPAIGGTIMLSELKAGVIPHMLAIAIPAPKKGAFVSPAQRTDGWATWSTAIPEGTVFRFPSNIYIDPAWSPLIKMIVTAVRDYGMIVRDKAGSVVFFGEDPRQYGSGDPYAAYYGGKALWDVMKQFPWSKLQAPV